MHVIDHATRPVAHLPGIEHRTLAGSAEGLRQLSVWQQSIDPGQATPPHRHDCDEVVVITEGSGELLIGGGVERFRAGQSLVIPRNVDHQIVNTGSGPLRSIAAFAMTPVEVHLPDGQPLALPWAS